MLKHFSEYNKSLCDIARECDAMQMDVHKTLYPFYPISLRWLMLTSQFFV